MDSSTFDVTEFRGHFPQLDDLTGSTYLDSAATSLMPKPVAQRVYEYSINERANIHRGSHKWGRKGTENYEKCRQQIKDFVSADESYEAVFTKGVTESINLIANGISSLNTVFVSSHEHHANIVPWQMRAQDKETKVQFLEFSNDGSCDLNRIEEQFSNTKAAIVSLMLYSNVTGARLHVEPVIQLAKQYNLLTCVDAAQAVLTEEMSIVDLDVDYLTFSAHKMFGPFGVGVLVGRKKELAKLKPLFGGGSMISRVSRETHSLQDIPHCFEAGTPNISGVLGLSAALDFIGNYGVHSWKEYEATLLSELISYLKTYEQVKVLPTSSDFYAPVVSFSVEGVHSSDVAEMLDQSGVAVRSGHHCAQPLMNKQGLDKGTVRVSLAPYNNDYDLENFKVAFKKAMEIILC